MSLGPELCSHAHAGARKCKQRVSTSEYIGRIQLRPASSLAPDAIAHRQRITSETQCAISPQLKHGVWHLVRDATPRRHSLHTLQANALASSHSFIFPNSHPYIYCTEPVHKALHMCTLECRITQCHVVSIEYSSYLM